MSEAVQHYPEPGGQEFTSGWSGSETSRERAVEEDRKGITANRHREALAMVQVCGADGLTVVELREISSLHHGQASAALSRLHKEGKIARLQERRDRCQVYVAPEYVGDRPVSEYRRNKSRENEARQLLLRVSYLRQYGDGLGDSWEKFDNDVKEWLRG